MRILEERENYILRYEHYRPLKYSYRERKRMAHVSITPKNHLQNIELYHAWGAYTNLEKTLKRLSKKLIKAVNKEYKNG